MQSEPLLEKDDIDLEKDDIDLEKDDIDTDNDKEDDEYAEFCEWLDRYTRPIAWANIILNIIYVLLFRYDNRNDFMIGPIALPVYHDISSLIMCNVVIIGSVWLLLPLKYRRTRSITFILFTVLFVIALIIRYK